MFSNRFKKLSTIFVVCLSFTLAGCGDDDDDPVSDGGGSGNGGGSGSTTVALPVDFESTNATFNFTDFDGGSVVVIDNPQTTGNSSAKVAQMVKDGGQTWGGSKLTLDTAIDFANGDLFTMNVYSTRAVPVLFKFEDTTTPTANTAEMTANHTGSGWESLSFNFTGFTAGLGTVVDIVFIFDNGVLGDHSNNPDDWIFYMDDIVQSAAPINNGATDPTDAPSAPTAQASDVISIYSEAYTNVSGVDTNPNWGQATVTTEETIASNAVLKMAGLNYQGIDWAASAQNISCLANLHVDYWTSDATEFDIYLVGSNGEREFEASVTTGSWQSLTIPLSTYSNAGLNMFAVKQFKFVGNGTVYVDNLYFSADAGNGTSCPAEVVSAPTDAPATPSADPANVISLFSDAYTDVASNTTPGWGEAIVNESHASNNVIKTSNFLPFVPGAPIDISSKTTMHVDIWLPELPSAGAGLLIKLLDAANGPHEANYTYPVASITAGQWNSIDIPLSSFVQVNGTWDATAQGRVDQILVDIVDDATMYVDNVYFY